MFTFTFERHGGGDTGQKRRGAPCASVRTFQAASLLLLRNGREGGVSASPSKLRNTAWDPPVGRGKAVLEFKNGKNVTYLPKCIMPLCNQKLGRIIRAIAAAFPSSGSIWTSFAHSRPTSSKMRPMGVPGAKPLHIVDWGGGWVIAESPKIWTPPTYTRSPPLTGFWLLPSPYQYSNLHPKRVLSALTRAKPHGRVPHGGPAQPRQGPSRAHRRAAVRPGPCLMGRLRGLS